MCSWYKAGGGVSTKAVMELDWRGLAAAFKSTPADVILGGAPGALLNIQLLV